MLTFGLCTRSYARGILFGKMVLELGDHSKIRNEANDLTADVEFKTKVSLDDIRSGRIASL